MAAPCTPSKDEVEEHEVTHWPYRSWCPDCVQGRGRAAQHRGRHDYMLEPGDPIVVADYMFPGGRDDTRSTATMTFDDRWADLRP